MKHGPKPRQITQDLLDQIEYHAARGPSQKQICDALGFSETWWHAKKAEFSELGECYKRGEASGLADVTNDLYENAMSGNPISQFFLMLLHLMFLPDELFFHIHQHLSYLLHESKNQFLYL